MYEVFGGYCRSVNKSIICFKDIVSVRVGGILHWGVLDCVCSTYGIIFGIDEGYDFGYSS